MVYGPYHTLLPLLVAPFSPLDLSQELYSCRRLVLNRTFLIVAFVVSCMEKAVRRTVEKEKLLVVSRSL